MTKYRRFLLPIVLGLPTMTLAAELPPRLLESVNQVLPPGTQPERVSESPIPRSLRGHVQPELNPLCTQRR